MIPTSVAKLPDTHGLCRALVHGAQLVCVCAVRLRSNVSNIEIVLDDLVVSVLQILHLSHDFAMALLRCF